MVLFSRVSDTKAALSRVAVCVLLLSLSGCSMQDFHIKNLAKSDVDMVADSILKETRDLLQEFLIKLYKRNPKELSKVPGMTVEERLAMIFQQRGLLVFDELNHIQEIEAMNLVFSDQFDGDRVFALIVGLTGMLRRAYNYDDDFFIYEDLDAQRLYDSARNVEVVAWKLTNKKDSQGNSFLVTNTHNQIVDNLSFERIYGKLIQTQDLMAKIIADKNNRTINTVIKGTLSVFLPI